jgi:hypothetical protein
MTGTAKLQFLRKEAVVLRFFNGSGSFDGTPSGEKAQNW